MRQLIFSGHLCVMRASRSNQALVHLERRKSGASAIGIGHLQQLMLGIELEGRRGIGRNLLPRASRSGVRSGTGQSCARSHVEGDRGDEDQEHLRLRVAEKPIQRAFQMPMPTFQMPPGETALLRKE